MDDYQQFYQHYSAFCDIFIVYILEAHFVETNDTGTIVDGWPIGKQYNYPQHKTLQDRFNMAQTLRDEFPQCTIPVLIDSMGDTSLQNTYHLWPDGAIMAYNGTIRYISRINDEGSRATTWTNEIQPLLNDILLAR